MESIIIIICIIIAVSLNQKMKGITIQALYKTIENSWYKFLIKPMMLALPSATLACYKIEPLKSKIPVEVIARIDEWVLFLVGGLFLVPVITSFEDLIRKRAPAYSHDLPSDGHALLLTALDYSVDKKMNHFLSVLSSARSGMKFGDIFLKITNPDRQLAEITRAIHIFFTGLSQASEEEIDFTTVLFKMSNGVPVESLCYFPESERPEQNLLNDPSSLAANSAKSGKMIVIRDIEKERRKSKSQISKHCQTEKGSAICFPIKSGHTKSVPLVLRITANKTYFSPDDKEMYKQILDPFKKRILIEYALSELKNYGTK